jgi:hypothetical protein
MKKHSSRLKVILKNRKLLGAALVLALLITATVVWLIKPTALFEEDAKGHLKSMEKTAQKTRQTMDDLFSSYNGKEQMSTHLGRGLEKRCELGGVTPEGGKYAVSGIHNLVCFITNDYSNHGDGYSYSVVIYMGTGQADTKKIMVDAKTKLKKLGYKITDEWLATPENQLGFSSLAAKKGDCEVWVDDRFVKAGEYDTVIGARLNENSSYVAYKLRCSQVVLENQPGGYMNTCSNTDADKVPKGYLCE